MCFSKSRAGNRSWRSIPAGLVHQARPLCRPRASCAPSSCAATSPRMRTDADCCNWSTRFPPADPICDLLVSLRYQRRPCATSRRHRPGRIGDGRQTQPACSTSAATTARCWRTIQPVQRVGIDPSDIARRGWRNRPDHNHACFRREQTTEILPQAANSTSSPRSRCSTTSRIRSLLRRASTPAPDGLWVFEMSYMPTMLLTNPSIHLPRASGILQPGGDRVIIVRAGVRIFNAGSRTINGGSLRCYASRASGNTYAIGAATNSTPAAGPTRVRAGAGHRQALRVLPGAHRTPARELTALLERIAAPGERIHIYGASTKGNVMLQWYGSTRPRRVAADRNPDKDGARTLGTDIPIVTEEESRARSPTTTWCSPGTSRRSSWSANGRRSSPGAK